MKYQGFIYQVIRKKNIANEVKISVGTVNVLVNKIMKIDDTFDLQRQIAIVSKKNGIDI